MHVPSKQRTPGTTYPLGFQFTNFKEWTDKRTSITLPISRRQGLLLLAITKMEEEHASGSSKLVGNLVPFYNDRDEKTLQLISTMFDSKQKLYFMFNCDAFTLCIKGSVLSPLLDATVGRCGGL